MFVAPAERDSAAYREFWAKLGRGEFQSAEYKRFGKGGKEVWILASYNPILDDAGKPFKVVKFASDITEQKLKTANFAGQIEAIGKSQAVIEFDMDGKVLTANQNFLGALGYSLAEIQGKHHSMFVPPTRRATATAIARSGPASNRGEFQSGEYERVGKGGRQDLDSGVLQPDPRPQRQALQGGEIRHRHHGAGDRADAQREGSRLDGDGRRRRRGTQRVGARNLGRDGEVEGNRARQRSIASTPPTGRRSA